MKLISDRTSTIVLQEVIGVILLELNHNSAAIQPVA
jgi:hypothetical protein